MDAAITIGRQAIQTAAEDDEELPAYIQDVALALMARFGQASDKADLDDAVVDFRQAVDALPEGHPYAADYLRAYGDSLLARFAVRGEGASLWMPGSAPACRRRRASPTPATIPCTQRFSARLADSRSGSSWSADRRTLTRASLSSAGRLT